MSYTESRDFEPSGKASNLGKKIRNLFLAGLATAAGVLYLKESRQNASVNTPEPSGETHYDYVPVTSLPDYIVQPGDSFTTISNKVYADIVHPVTYKQIDEMTGAELIAQANGKSIYSKRVEDMLHPGDELIIPVPAGYLRRVPAVSPTPTLAPGAATPISEIQEQPGDVDEAIAQNDHNQRPAVFRFTKNKFG